MKSMTMAAAIASALALAGGPALAATDCFKDMMARSTEVMQQAEKQGADQKMMAEAKKRRAEAQKLHDAGKETDALVMLGTSIDLIEKRGRQPGY